MPDSRCTWSGWIHINRCDRTCRCDSLIEDFELSGLTHDYPKCFIHELTNGCRSDSIENSACSSHML